MEWGRYQTGASLAAAALAGAAIAAAGKHPATGVVWALVTIAVLVLLAAFAPVFPLLKRAPLIGAPKLSVAVSYEMTVGTTASDGVVVLDLANIVLRVGVTNQGPGEVRRARVNVLVPATVEFFEASDGFGTVTSRGERMPNTSEPLAGNGMSAYYAERADFDEGATLLHYAIRVRDPGTFPVRVKIVGRGLRSVQEESSIVVDAPGPEPAA